MNYGKFIREIKPFLNNKTLSNEMLVNGFLEDIVSLGRIRKKKGPARGELLEYDKAESSKIVNNKLNLSSEIRDVLCDVDSKETIKKTVERFYLNDIDKSLVRDMTLRFMELAKQDKSFMQKELVDIENSKSDPTLFLSKILTHALKQPNYLNYEHSEFLVKKDRFRIRLVQGDIFRYIFNNSLKQRRIVAIPVNTSFDVHVTSLLEKEKNPLVSSMTLHGNLMLRLYKAGYSETEITNRIRDNLRLNGIKTKIGEPYNAPIGSVATFDIHNATVYLVAVSIFDNNNNAYSSKKDIEKAVCSLLNFYAQKGQGYDIFIPLMGTGMSRSGLSAQESFDLLMKETEKRKNSICGTVSIVVKPDTTEEIDFFSRRK